MRVKKRPHELAADVFEAKFKMRVLEDRVMPAVESGGADGQPLLVCDFLGADQPGSITSACRRDRRIERMRQISPECDARQRRFNIRYEWRVRHGRQLRGHFLWRIVHRLAVARDGALKFRQRRGKAAPLSANNHGNGKPKSLRRYFLSDAALSAYFFWNRSTRPAVSISFCLPVKNGGQFEQISTRIMAPLIVERVSNMLPQ